MIRKISQNKLLIGGTVLGLGCAALLYFKLYAKPKFSSNFKEVYAQLIAETKEEFKKAGPPTGVMPLDLYLRVGYLSSMKLHYEVPEYVKKFASERLACFEKDMEKYEGLIIDENLKDLNSMHPNLTKVVEALGISMDWFAYSMQSYENLDPEFLTNQLREYGKEAAGRITCSGAYNASNETWKQFYDMAFERLPQLVEKYPQSNPEIVEEFYMTMINDIGARDFGIDWHRLDPKFANDPFHFEQITKLLAKLSKIVKEAVQKAEELSKQR